MNDIFSVIVLCYNNAIYMEDCFSSILVQDYPKVEIVLADDCSREFDKNRFEDYIEKNRRSNIVSYTVYSNEENLGTVKSINRAIRKAKGAYYKILAIDDALYDSTVLSSAKNALDSCSDGIAYGETIYCDRNLIPNGQKAKYPPIKISTMSSEMTFKKLCETNIIDATGVFFDKRFFELYGYYDEKYRLLEDWPKWLEVTQKGCKLFYFPQIVAKYRSDCGTGTGVNKYELNDKRRAFDEYVRNNKKNIGFLYYFKCLIRFHITTSITIRKIYSFFFRKV